MTDCPVCGGPVATSPEIPGTAGAFRPAPPATIEAMRETGLCFQTPSGWECARERRIGRDADGNIHEAVAPATKIAFAQGPRIPRRAR